MSGQAGGTKGVDRWTCGRATLGVGPRDWDTLGKARLSAFAVLGPFLDHDRGSLHVLRGSCSLFVKSCCSVPLDVPLSSHPLSWYFAGRQP